MDKNYLLTYQKVQRIKGINGCEFIDTTFAWFDTEKEMDDFIEDNNIQVIDMLKINDAENLTT